jgi:hypothetical protein
MSKQKQKTLEITIKKEYLKLVPRHSNTEYKALYYSIAKHGKYKL